MNHNHIHPPGRRLTGFPDRTRRILPVFLLVLTVLIGIKAFAQLPEGQSTVPASENAQCLGCHGNPNLTTTLSSGETVNMGIDIPLFNESIHTSNGVACRDCHSNITGYPHPPIEFDSARAFTISRNGTCNQCHAEVTESMEGSAHAIALSGGNLSAAVCTDCHGSHDTRPLRGFAERTAHTCQGCHSQVFNLYRIGVHGSALLDEGNEDVPGCTTCHGTHKIEGPSTGPFRLFSPQRCATCHSDRDLMAKYNLNPNVMNSYIHDFHGKTVMFEQVTNPSQETDKAVCVDCHGVHNMLGPDDPNSTVSEQNILATCRKCHPNAGPNFPDAYLNHENPTPGKHPLVFFVSWFYYLLVPGLIGGMILFVITDFVRMKVDYRKERKNG